MIHAVIQRRCREEAMCAAIGSEVRADDHSGIVRPNGDGTIAAREIHRPERSLRKQKAVLDQVDVIEYPDRISPIIDCLNRCISLSRNINDSYRVVLQ